MPRERERSVRIRQAVEAVTADLRSALPSPVSLPLLAGSAEPDAGAPKAQILSK
jgi:hypothetical protein